MLPGIYGGRESVNTWKTTPMSKTLLTIANPLISGVAITIIIVAKWALLMALWIISPAFFLVVALIRALRWSINLLMPASSGNRATVILGVPYVLGFFLIRASGWDYLTEHSIPWETVVPTIGAALMAAALGLGVANARRVGGRVILAALVVMAAIPACLIIQEGWRTELITLFGVILGVLITEFVLSPALRRWCS